MTKRKRDHSLGEGVYFAPDDYVGIFRRIVILAVDLAVLVFVYVVFGSIWITIADDDPNGSFFLIYLLFVWAYLTVLKASKLRTVGYWVTGSRIIDLQGKRPSVFRMTFLTLLWVLGPFNLFFDLLWSGVDDDHQTLRDRFAGTCVVKARAEPIGVAGIHLVYYNAFALTLIYRRVMRPEIPKPQSHSETM